MDRMTEKQAQEYAPQWGSFITNGDPGAIMYSAVPPETAAARDAMVEHIKSDCFPAALRNDAERNDDDEPQEYTDHEDLQRLVAYLEGLSYPDRAPEEINGVDLDTFVNHYITAMLWATTDESDESGGVPLDENYGPSDLAPQAREEIENDCRAFLQAVGQFVTADNFKGRSSGHVENAGHDFFLTRCGHGAGFWDGDWQSDDLPGSESGPLSKASKEAGEVWPYVGDDGLIYHG